MPRRLLIGGIVATAVFLLLGRLAAATYVDYLWFASLDATELWRMEFENRLLIGGGSAIIAILFLFANLFAVRQSVVSLVLPRRLGNLEIGEEVPARYLTQLTIAVSVVLGLLAAFPRERWLEFAAARYGASFKERDQILEFDLGYYVNLLPFEKSVFIWCLILLVVVMALVLFLYALTPSLKWVKGEGLQVTHYVRRHAGVLCGCALLLLAWSFRLEMFDTMLQGSGVDGVFSASDQAMLSARTFLSIMALIAAFLLVWAMWSNQVKTAFVFVITVLLAALGTSAIVPIVVRESASTEDVAESEQQYEAFRAGRTRRAYAVDDVLPAEPASAFSFSSWSEAASGISAWDAGQFLAAASRKAAGGIAVGGAGYLPSTAGQVQVAIAESAAPIAPQGSPESAAPPVWSLVRARSASSLPDGSLRPAFDGDGVTPLHRVLISQPAPWYVLAADSMRRIAAPEMESPLSRLAHAWSRQDFRMLFSDLPQPAPRIILHASVRDRLQKLAPFFDQDSLIYPVLLRDTLFWAVQLYSHSATYPLSREFSVHGKQVRYYRHAATAIVNSATGHTAIYVAEKPDPIALTWATRLPQLLASAGAIPGEIAKFLPPAIDAARAQAAGYANYASRDSISSGFLADAIAGDSAHGFQPQSLIHLPMLNSTPAWIQPLLDGNKRLNGIIIAVGGATPHTYAMQTATANQNWHEVQRRFDAVRDSVAENEDGNVTTGPIRTVPVAGEPALIQTTYMQSASAGPVVAAVTIIRGDSISTAPGLTTAAHVRSPTGDDAVLTPSLFRARVEALYETMRVALGKKDLVAFAEAFNALGALLAGVRR